MKGNNKRQGKRPITLWLEEDELLNLKAKLDRTPLPTIDLIVVGVLMEIIKTRGDIVW